MTDKQIVDTLQNIIKNCYRGCDNCVFSGKVEHLKIGGYGGVSNCLIKKIASELLCSNPSVWDIERLKELIEQ